MAWNDSPCDLEARTKQGLPSGRDRTCRVNRRLLRIVWSELHGVPWPEGMFACHHCDEPRCANPHHIFPGTCSDNSKDAFRKHGNWGAIRKGENHAIAKLRNQDVLRIKQRLHAGVRQRSLAAEYGVSKGTIASIATGKNWGWLE